MNVLNKLYERLPVWGQNIGVSAFGAYWYWQRFGSGFARHRAAYQKREQFTETQWRTWQQQRLTEVLSVASQHVPYYRATWTNAEKQAAAEGQLAALPLLSKDPIRENPDAFVREDVSTHRPLRLHTSGSTGTPVVAIFTVDELRASRAVREVRSAGWAGVSFREPRATFSGRIVVPQANSAGPYWRYNLIERQVYFSAFHLGPATAADYVAALHKHRPTWMTGYAVSYHLLAKYILEQDLEVPPLKAVITTSEKVTSEMRSVMEAAYHCRVYEEYGTVENVHFASECKAGRLHVSPDVGVVELLHPDGSACSVGEVGEVIVTSLSRMHQPFIRYRVGDLAAWDTEPCPCGCSMPVLKEIVGRMEDVITGPDGRQLVRFHGIFVDQPHVHEGQVIQETLSQFKVKIVPTSGFGVPDIMDIQHRMKQRLGDQIEVQVECVNQIPRNKSGKYRAVVSLLDSQKKSAVA